MAPPSSRCSESPWSPSSRARRIPSPLSSATPRRCPPPSPLQLTGPVMPILSIYRSWESWIDAQHWLWELPLSLSRARRILEEQPSQSRFRTLTSNPCIHGQVSQRMSSRCCAWRKAYRHGPWASCGRRQWSELREEALGLIKGGISVLSPSPAISIMGKREREKWWGWLGALAFEIWRRKRGSWATVAASASKYTWSSTSFTFSLLLLLVCHLCGCKNPRQHPFFSRPPWQELKGTCHDVSPQRHRHSWSYSSNMHLLTTG